MATPVGRKIWVATGRSLYALSQPGIKLVVRDSHRTRILVVCGDDYLLVKHWLGRDCWMLPGGGCHNAEDPLDGAQRELHEEVGIDLGREAFIHVGQYLCRDDGFRFSYDLYVVNLSERPKLRLQRIEILEATWFKLAVKPPFTVSPEVKIALQNQIPKVGHVS